jgi:hypothetical protein
MCTHYVSALTNILRGIFNLAAVTMPHAPTSPHPEASNVANMRPWLLKLVLKALLGLAIGAFPTTAFGKAGAPRNWA